MYHLAAVSREVTVEFPVSAKQWSCSSNDSWTGVGQVQEHGSDTIWSSCVLLAKSSIEILSSLWAEVPSS